MNWYEVGRDLQQLWQNRPQVIWLVLLGLAVFLFLVIDAWRHKRRKRRKQSRKHGSP